MKVTRRGQTTLPAEYRARLGINEGDELVVEEAGNQLTQREVWRTKKAHHALAVG